MSHKFTDPFHILDIIRTQAYHLTLPASYSHLHDVFHVFYLEPYNHQDGAIEVELMPPPELIEDEEEWEVEEVIGKKKIKGAVSYMVRWKGWSADYNEWVKESDMLHMESLQHEFEQRQKKKGQRRAKPNA